MRTERRLAQEGGHELVAVDLVDATPHRAPAPVEARALLELAAGPARAGGLAAASAVRSADIGRRRFHSRRLREFRWNCAKAMFSND